jgi:hypothetical protein
MTSMTVLQIVPQLPGSFDGVGDYALILARRLQQDYQIGSIFAAGGPNTAAVKQTEFPVASDLNSIADSGAAFEHVILHYANYGYQTRGVPLRLRKVARDVRKRLRGRWLTTFHELYAFGPPWRSAFWLYPLQARVARDMIDTSDSCFVSSDVIKKEIQSYDSQKPVHLLPVMSNFGEPRLKSFNGRSPKHWAICGGTRLISRSLRSLAEALPLIPEIYFPEQLEVIGGCEQAEIRDEIATLTRNWRGLSCRYHPEVDAARASELLSSCSFAWIDYFGKGNVWPGMIFKSSSFAACGAHAVVPILSHAEAPPALSGDLFPAWYFISRNGAHFPEPQHLSATREQIYGWYHRHASAQRTARAYAEALA